MRREFTRVYRETYPQVLAFCRRRTSGDVAEDLTADIYTRAWRRFADLSDRDNPLPWLYGIARNVVGQHYRTMSRHPQSALDGEDVAVPALAEAIDTSIDINRALLKLSGPDQEVLMLIAWEGLDPAEAADVLGITANSCRVRVHRARTRLAQALGSNQEGLHHD